MPAPILEAACHDELFNQGIASAVMKRYRQAPNRTAANKFFSDESPN
ncbi:hypothetical protein [Vibrio cortegadensis]|nr:hypothetical protein [Vibrio cortegadensis]